jgi:hypothetical protein
MNTEDIVLTAVLVAHLLLTSYLIFRTLKFIPYADK